MSKVAKIHTTACGTEPFDKNFGVGAQKHLVSGGYSPYPRIEKLRKLFRETPLTLYSTRALDITDIRRVGIREKDDGTRTVVFTHVYVNDKKVDGYSNSFLMESLSLRRLVAIGIAFFTSFVSEKVLLIDDFGQLLHPDVLCHLVEIFESCNKQSQMLVVDCNPSLLKEGLLRKDAIWFAQKDNESSTVFYSLSDFKGRSRTSNYNRYLQGAFGALPVTSDFYFVHDGTPVNDEEGTKEEN